MSKSGKDRLIIISSLLAFIIIILVFIYIYRNKDVVTDPEQYLITEGAFDMDLEVFPKHIKKNNVIEYRYHPQFSFLVDDSQYLYLKNKYSKKDYIREKRRLKGIKNEFTRIKIDKKWLNKESYILYFNYGGISEFAVCDNEHRKIEYVYVQEPKFYYFEKYRNDIVRDKTYDNENNDCDTMPLGR